jgi:hypothetical protein
MSSEIVPMVTHNRRLRYLRTRQVKNTKGTRRLSVTFLLSSLRPASPKHKDAKRLKEK